jgi:hypothetical protein
LISIANDFVIAAKPDKGIGWFEWRAQLLTCALWCALVCGGAAFWGSLLTNPEHIHLNAVLALAAYHLWLLAVAVVGKYPYWLRAASLLLALLAAGCVLIYFSTQLVVGISFIFSFITLSILLLGLQGGAVAAILCIGCLAAATYLLPARGYIFFTQSEPATIVNAFVVGGLSLFAAATAIIPLQLYLMGSYIAFQHGKEQLLEAEQHRIQYQQSLGLITREYDAHLLSEKTLAETIVLLVTARSQDKLLTNALNLIVNNFGFQRAEIFYQADNLKLIHAVHFIDGEGFANQQYDVLDIDQTPIMVQQIVTAEQPQQIMIDWTSAAGADIEAGNVATVWMPISTGRHTAGVLKISKHQGKAFLETEVNALKTNAQLLALGLLNIQISMDGQLQPGNISSANQAIQLLNKAETRDQILKIVQNTFMISTFPSIMFSTDRDVFRLVSVNDPVDSADMEWNPANFSRESFEKLAESNPYFPFQLNDQIDLPEELMNLLLQLGWDCAAFIPIYQNGHLNTLYVLGSRQLPELTPLSIQPYANLAGYATSTL